MVLVQILLGGITRLTGSGLSITRWEIVTGAIPPLNYLQWQEAFGLYKESPQYQHINRGMSLDQFKFIFFWEYIHRLWARTMGIVFIIPFVYFLVRGSIGRRLLKNLSVVIFLAASAALFGWIMVASGLIERPWVNAYNLAVHLSLGILLFISLFYSWLNHLGFEKSNLNRHWRNGLKVLIALTSVQIVFGGFVSGMKASLSYPTWPMMNGSWLPSIVLDKNQWNENNFLLYDKTGFVPALVLFVHRNLAYLLVILIIIFSIKWYRLQEAKWRWVTFVLLGIIVVQVGLGILILLNSKGSIPVFYGSFHQGVGILFITFLVYLHLIVKPDNIKELS